MNSIEKRQYALPSQRLSIKELNNLSQVRMTHDFPIKLYVRSTMNLLQQAKVYQQEDDLEKAYILYMKLSNLVINELPKHSAYKAPENKSFIVIGRKNCMKALTELEILKPAIEKQYNDYVNRIKTWKKGAVPKKEKSTVEPKNQEKSNIEGTKANNDSPDDFENLPSFDPNWSVASALPNFKSMLKPNSAVLDPFPTQKYNISPYPSINKQIHYQPEIRENKELYKRPAAPIPQSPLSTNLPSFTLPPQLTVNKQLKPPPLPPKPDIEYSLDDNSLEDVVSLNSAKTERGEPLRNVYLPSGIVEEFLNVANKNTLANLETCAILCGVLKRGSFTVTALIVPKQVATSDTCSTINEEELFVVQDQKSLLTIGWIHTHPSQTCFLSSVDLHTHLSYQLMLPEAMAIVCAPKFNPNLGTFRLTDPPGLNTILECKEPNAFHPHPNLTLYTNADDKDNGHVQYVKGQPFEVIDLR